MTATLSETELLALSDSELRAIISSSLLLSSLANRVHSLSPTLVAKQVTSERLEDECRALDLARELNISVPQVRRVVAGEPAYIILDRIHGTPLEEKWENIGFLSSILLFSTP
jgi:hypothetical protein